MNLTADNLSKIYLECLKASNESDHNVTNGNGVAGLTPFDTDRLEARREDIENMLSYLSDDFKPTGGGGMSFLNMCVDRYGVQWADLHSTVDQLVSLGNAIGKVNFLLPRDSWNIFPGGMPYVVVDAK